MKIQRPGPKLLRAARWPILGAIAIGTAIVASVLWPESGPQGASAPMGDNSPRASSDLRESGLWRRADAPGIDRPPTVPADSAKIADDEEVLGVIVDGHPRAYRLLPFHKNSAHIVNDVVGNRPVSMTYCDLTDCVRAYSGPPGAGPLDIRQGGLQYGRMIVRVGDAYYWHRDGQPHDPDAHAPPFPYPDCPFERRKWGEWRRLHPETDIYLGPPPARH